MGALGAQALCYHLERDPAVLNAALHIFLTTIERGLRQHSPGTSAASRLGAVIFIHRFGVLLNAHLHFHCIVIDGVFEADAQDSPRQRSGCASDRGGGFSVDAAVRIEAHERDGLERLLRYCARPVRVRSAHRVVGNKTNRLARRGRLVPVAT